MRHRPVNLAIETSSRVSSVVLGRDDVILAEVVMPPQRRHTVDLMPTIDTLCRHHAVHRGDIGQVYVSVGPGSFTGLRIAVASVKMLAMTLDVRIVAVPTIEVVAAGAPAEHRLIAVGLNSKREQMYAAAYERQGGRIIQRLAPELRTASELCEALAEPFAVMGDHLPAYDWPSTVTVLPVEAAQPTAGNVWRIGRAMAAADQFADARSLAPLYVRPPEAVTLWEARHNNA
jgi:tRNA threonylcarbamoyladenosine biosynthesis protein TsaB